MNFKGIFIAAGLLSCLSTAALADGGKRAMEIEDLNDWQKVGSIMNSDDGNILSWVVSPQEGDGTLYIRKFQTSRKGSTAKAEQIAVERADGAILDPSGKWLFCKIKPEFKVTRKEKIDKVKKEKMTPDTLGVVDLSTLTLKKYPVVKEFKTGTFAMPLLAYKSTWEVETPAKEEGKKSTKETKSALIVLNPTTSQADTILNADKFAFSANGELLAFSTAKDKKDSLSFNSMQLAWYNNGKIETEILSKDKEKYGQPVFSDKEDKLAFTASTDTVKSGDSRYSLNLSSISRTAATKKTPASLEVSTKEIISQEYTDAKTGWALDQNSTVFFTPDGNRLVTGLSSIRPPKDTSIVPFETAQLDIWNWDAPYTPPQSKADQKDITDKTYQAVVNLNGNTTPVLLSEKYFESITFLNSGASDWALAQDESDYVRASVWNYNSFVDLSLVNLNDGSRKQVAKKLDVGSLSVSPLGKHIAYFNNEDLQWHCMNLETLADVNLSANCGVAFYNEENDMPTAPRVYDWNPLWVEGDQAVIIADRYDIWKFAPDGSRAENITGGVLRDEKLKFAWISDLNRRTYTSNQSKSNFRQSYPAKSKFYVYVMHDENKTHGFASFELAKPGKTLKYFTDTAAYRNTTKALNSQRIFFTKENFRNCPDLYATADGDFLNCEKLSSINPQKENFRWGNAELFSWTGYDGTPLKGLVFIPEGVKEGEKLPVIVYYYEKNTQEMYSFYTPGPSRSIVNPSYYNSRGYIFFIPDIVYKVGHPGESAYNCICSGTEALCEAYPIADKSKMAIQGQSWGGYQTAYLVTRTDMFAAAGAGAPVGNMTSAYGGIRWGTGITRAGQYEHGQSRIGKTLWDKGGLELYIENSPVFHLDKVNTPLLIMHNDDDGAVPWYQGIEIFSDLRRLEKPVWMLQYNNEAHNLVERRNCLDLTRRLQQFFDHYLKGAPLPAWMKSGIPIDRKGEYFGFENAE